MSDDYSYDAGSYDNHSYDVDSYGGNYGTRSSSSYRTRASDYRGRPTPFRVSLTRPWPHRNNFNRAMSTSHSTVFPIKSKTPKVSVQPEPKKVTHPSTKIIEIYHQSTTVKTDKPQHKDVHKEPIVKLVGQYNFFSKQFELSFRKNRSSGQFDISAYELTSGKTNFVVNLEGMKMTIDLADRHVFDRNFYMLLKYSYVDNLGDFQFESKFHFKIPYFLTETEIVFKQLEHFCPSEEITNVFYADIAADNSTGHPAKTLESYRELSLFKKLEKAIYFEDLAARDAIKHLSSGNMRVEGAHKNYFLSFDPKTVRDIKKERWREMSLCLIPMEKYRRIYNKPVNCFFVQIGDILKNKLTIDSMKRLDQNFDYHVDFIPNRIGTRACLNALQTLNASELSTFFMNYEHRSTRHIFMTSRVVTSDKINTLKRTQFSVFTIDWFNNSIGSNVEQQLAIQNILNCTAYPLPQIVFGPPGTGKTSTLVECVAQLVKLRPKSRILIATQSNSASDDIGVRLLKHVSMNEVYRFYSPSLLNTLSGGPNKILKASSNLRSSKRVEWPTKEEINHFNVVISTLISSSRLAQSDIGKGHFDYIFVDEISCATEPEALVTIIGLGTSGQTVTANIVLLGDHKQLGPVLTSEKFSGALGLGTSLMERMMSCATYKKNPHFDDRYVVQLLDNYRSHPAILKFSSDKFYDGTLRPKMSQHDQKLTEAWNFLPNKKFPIIFHSSTSPSQLEGTSSYNMGEINAVRKYVVLLLSTKFDGKNIVQSDIGIISPYLAQLKKLKEVIGAQWDKIEMGTAEHFQGREKRVIIISTVKSQGGIGFLSNEKRCNVMLTRAKSFEVVIGNPQTLSKDPFWKAFIDYCRENHSIAIFTEVDLSDQFERLNCL